MTSSQAQNETQAHEMALQGAALYQGGQTAQALEICQQALRLAPRSCEVLLLLAFIALHTDRPHESIVLINRALAENDKLADAYFLRGEAQQKVQLHEAAAASYDEVLKLKPDHADALNNRGNAYQALGQHERALQSYDEALALNPAKASFHTNRGLAFKELGARPLAVACFEQAIALQSDYGLAHFNLGLLLFSMDRYQEAAASHAEAIECMPGHASSHWGHADALRASGQYEASLRSYNTALSLEPNHADIYNNRGLLLHYWGKHHDALRDFATATQLDPGHVDAYCNRGMTLEALGRHVEALDQYEAVLERSPHHAGAHFNRALCNLTLGHFRDGWREHEWRWQTAQLTSSKRDFDKPLWLGNESLQGRRILVHAEQGFGDSLQFCRYLPMLVELGATLIVQVQVPLVPLIRTMSGVSQVVARGEAPLAEFDFHCPFMSLPLAFGTTLQTVPCPPRYLSPSGEKSLYWRERLGAKHLPRIGLVWATARHPLRATQRPLAARKSIPLEKFAALNTLEAVFFSLQKGVAASELHELEQARWNGPAIADHTAELRDFEDTAAFIDQLDLVISVDTAVAHLAGALGKPVWLLNRFDTDWRWMVGRDDSPWYPSMRIFRQPVEGDWDSVVARVEGELRRALSVEGLSFDALPGWQPSPTSGMAGLRKRWK